MRTVGLEQQSVARNRFESLSRFGRGRGKSALREGEEGSEFDRLFDLLRRRGPAVQEPDGRFRIFAHNLQYAFVCAH